MSTPLERLKDLAAKATPGPWYAVHTDDRMCMNTVYVTTDAADDAPPDEHPGNIVALTLYQASDVAVHEVGKWDEDAEFIATARQAVPVLVELCEALEWERETRDEELQTFILAGPHSFGTSLDGLKELGAIQKNATASVKSARQALEEACPEA